MNKTVVAILTLVSVYLIAHFASRPPSLPDAEEQVKLAPGEWLDMRRLHGSDITLNQRVRVNTQLQRRSENAKTISAQGADAWEFIGPVNIGGRVVDLAVDPVATNTIYAAAASGGVWRSTDAGDTFTSIWPDTNAQGMGALAISSTGQLYAGTGESNPGGGSLTYGNAGVFKQDANGQTWTSLGLANTERISRIVIDPTDESRLFVAATGPLYSPGGERGVYRTADGGTTWQQVLAGANDTTGASDVLIDPDNPGRLYAALWDHQRQPALRRYGGVGSGLFRSDNSGDTWVRMSNGLPPAGDNIGRVSIGLAPSNPDVLYAVYLDTRGFFTGFYRSDNGGDSWALQPFSGNLANSQSSFGWWFARIWVDPADANHVFVAGVTLPESVNGGATFTAQSSIHADQHAMAWDPHAANRVYLGNDGGVYRSDNNGSAPWTFATSQPFTQFYTLDVSEQDPQRVVGGTQDNRCLRSYDSGGAPLWNQYGSCGDGLETLINPLDQNIVYSCSQYGNCGVSFNAGNASSPLGGISSPRRNWLTPLVFDPRNPQTIYYAGNLVERSTDFGQSFQPISADLTGGDPFPSPIDPYPFGTVTTLDVSALDTNDILFGTDDGLVYRTGNLGTDWSLVNSGLPERWVTRVVFDPAVDGTAYISFSGFRDSDNTAYVFKTTSGGQNWIDITTDLPSAPVNAMTLTPGGQLVVANDVGVYLRNANGNWDAPGINLPVVPVTDVRVIGATNTLYASTFGRGIWKLATVFDADNDGHPDAADNCSHEFNSAQTDTDGDGYGNACDPDFDQNCQVTFGDVAQFPPNFLTGSALHDMNSDGTVNFGDYTLLIKRFLQAPGPSGVAGICVPPD